MSNAFYFAVVFSEASVSVAFTTFAVCLNENNIISTIQLNFRHDYITVTHNRNYNRLNSFFKRRCPYSVSDIAS